jgi:hypothetical protein
MRGMLSLAGNFEQRRYRIATVKDAGTTYENAIIKTHTGLSMCIAASGRFRLQSKH